jgi:hypothetical protein
MLINALIDGYLLSKFAHLNISMDFSRIPNYKFPPDIGTASNKLPENKDRYQSAVSLVLVIDPKS